MIRRLLAASVALAVATTFPGCTTSPPQWFGFTSGAYANDLPAVSSTNGSVLEPSYTTAVYRYLDPSSADIYLTDVPVSSVVGADGEGGGEPVALDGGDSERPGGAGARGAGLRGAVLHVHMFLVPEAGSTPIDSTACNASLRLFVFNGRGGMGVYAGGAFVMPASDRLGQRTLAGVVRGGSLRLVQATPDFVDLIGPSTIRGSFSAQLDDQAGRALAVRLAERTAGVPAASTAVSGTPEATATGGAGMGAAAAE